MNVRELIEILQDMPPETEVELAIVAPVAEDEDIEVDHYAIRGVVPWPADEEDDEDEDAIWLVGGEEDKDVEDFFDALDAEDDEEA